MDELIAGRYRLIEPLGHGGMAEVFIAEQSGPRGFSRRVVLKRIRDHLAKDDTFVRSFEDEARLAALLQHPNIVRTEDFGEHDGQLFMVLEHVLGDELTDLSKAAHAHDQALPLQLILQVGVDIADALDHAHKQCDADGKALGVVHRDVSPQNMMITQEGQGKLLDFGIARASINHEQTEAGQVKGKAAYFSPEQIKNADLDGRCDQFALAVVLYELLTRRRLFADRDLISTLQRVVRCQVPKLDLFRADLSPELEHTLKRALSRDRGYRFTDCAQMAEALNSCLDAAGGRLDARRYKTWRSALSLEKKKAFVPVHAGVHSPAKQDQRATQVADAGTMEISLDGPTPDEGTQLFTSSDADDEREDDAPTESSLTQTNIDVPLDTFVGRVGELQTIKDLLDQGKRLITLLGAGGSGKTRLAVQFGGQNIQHFPGGLWFCDLSEAMSAHDVIDSVAKSLNLELSGTDHSAHIGRCLAGRDQMLLILDNVEQITDAMCPLLSTWLRMAPQATFLVTSRTRLQMAGESVLMVDPLALPDAMQLFADRAKTANPSFVLDQDNQAIIKEIVERLDCMSLAIELAAARVRMMTPVMIHKRLAQRFKLLRGKRSDQSERQNTLRGAVEWSWNLLNQAQQMTWTQISVFHRGFTLEAAEAVVDLSSCDDEPWMLDVLGELVDQSLLRLETDQQGNGRYHLLETIRAFGLEQLGNQEHATKDRHASYFAGSTDPNLPLFLQSKAEPWPDVEEHNVRFAFDHAMQQAQQKTGLALGWQLTEKLPFTFQKHFNDHDLLPSMMTLAESGSLAAASIQSRLGTPEALDQAEAILRNQPHAGIEWYCELQRAWALRNQGDFEAALQRAFKLENFPQNDQQRIYTIGHTVKLLMETGNGQAALERLAASKSLYVGDEIFTFLDHEAEIYLNQSRLKDARSSCQLIAAKAEELGHFKRQNKYLSCASEIEVNFDPRKAVVLAQRLLRISRRHGYEYGIIAGYFFHSTALIIEGKNDEAKALLYQGLDHFIGDQWLTHHYWLAGRIGAGLTELGDHKKGLELLNKAVEFFRTAHSAEYGFVLSARSHAHLLDHDLEQAQADYQEAQSHKPYMTDSVLRRLHGMRLYHALGDQSATTTIGRQALELAQEMGCGPDTALYDRVTRLGAQLNINL